MRRLSSKNMIVMAVLVCVTTAVTVSAQNFAAENFNSAAGGNPNAGPMIQGLNGHLYGVSDGGGLGADCSAYNGCGTVFELTPSGNLSALYSFCSQPNCTDGIIPEAALILGADGNFYGTTSSGGANGFVNGYGSLGGTVFKLTLTGQLTTLYSFCSQVNLYSVCLDGSGPYGLVQASDGNLYGMTSQGGTPNQGLNCYSPDGGEFGCGTVFKITTSGKFQTLYNFCPAVNGNYLCPDGQSPQSTLVQGNDGNLYGVTPYGGVNPCFGAGCGTIFKITRSGVLSTLYSFCPDQAACVDGENPKTLTLATNGNFYGVVPQGGPDGGGSVFRFSNPGSISTVYGFCSVSNGGPCPDGSNPASLMQASDGNFYGTTLVGGANCPINSSYGCGTVFQLTPAGAITILHSFCLTNCYDGTDPAATLAQATNGPLYGLTESEGADHGCINGCGALYRLSNGLAPFVQANPSFGKVGRVITILGSNLAGTTGVTFNGTPATFYSVFANHLEAVVPGGATTGTIQVTTLSGTLSSNRAFQVQ